MGSERGDISIGELAAKSGVQIETIRYYEREGILPKAGRTAGGHRTFDERHLRRLLFIKRTRGLGFAGEEFKELIALLEQGYKCQDVQRIASTHLDSVRQRIRELAEIETFIVDLLNGCGDGASRTCHIVDRLSAQEQSGGGARRSVRS
jgi:MerR family mercuric resistance operon transcriptional regulator